MDVHLVDGTYELFRHFFAVPSQLDVEGNEVGAVRGVLSSMLGLIESGASHLGVATDHVVESFRNELYPGYKTSEGVPATLMSQFPVLEEALESMGVRVWPMTCYEADDALASAAARAEADARVERVLICTPDKDLAQCVSGTRVVQLDRRRGITRDDAGVVAKWGVKPESIPDYLALVGDNSDGYPGLPGWGEKATSQVLAVFPHFEDIPQDWRQWPGTIRGAMKLSAVLRERWDEALLYRTLATLKRDAPVFECVDQLQWQGPRNGFSRTCERFKAPALFARAIAAGEAVAIRTNSQGPHLVP